MLNFLVSQKIVSDKYGYICDCLEASYTRYFHLLGINLLPISNFLEDPEGCLDGLSYHGLILTGGGTVNPKFSVQKIDSDPAFSPEREKVENYLITKLIVEKKLILGICHGMQQLNCFFGGQITKDIHKDTENKRKPGVNHQIRIIKSVFGLNNAYQINHYHNDGIKSRQLADCFTAFAIDADYDCLEGIIHKELPIIGLQWHPERESPDKSFNKLLIGNFIQN